MSSADSGNTYLDRVVAQQAVLEGDLRSRRAPSSASAAPGAAHRLPRPGLRQLHLIVSPETILRWHRDLMRRRHADASRRKRPGKTLHAIQVLVLRLARENSGWGYRRIHGELASLGIKVAPSTVWEILKQHGIEPAPERDRQTWAAFLRSQVHAILACDLFTATTLNGASVYVFAVIEHANRRIRILGATAHPTADWVTQAARNVVMDLQDAGATVTHLIRDRDSKYTRAFDAVFAAEGIEVVTTGIRVPRMNSIMERWVQTCRHELFDRTLIWNQAHLLHALAEFEVFYNQHRPHRTLHSAAPLRPVPEPITNPDRLDRLDIHRRDRLGGILHEVRTRGLTCPDVIIGTRREGAEPENTAAESIAWTFLHEPTLVTVAGHPAQQPRYRVVVGVPQATLDDDAKEGLVAEVTEQVLRAETNGQDPAPEDAFRVWVIVNEITDGNWGGAGRIFRLADILTFAGASDKEIERRTARLHSSPYRRRHRGSSGPASKLVRLHQLLNAASLTVVTPECCPWLGGQCGRASAA